jgi:hypothetical protein
LQEIFAVDVTVAHGTCGSCGAVEPVGAVHVYVSAGVVLRCPHCDAALMRVVSSRGRVWVDLTGLRTLELPL